MKDTDDMAEAGKAAQQTGEGDNKTPENQQDSRTDTSGGETAHEEAIPESPADREETCESPEGPEDEGSNGPIGDGKPDAEAGDEPDGEDAERENELEKKIAELEDKWLRAKAETENLRRRAERERENALKFAATNFAKDMLDVADNLRRALINLPEDRESMSPEITSFVEGVNLTERGLLTALERHGVEKIEAMGQKFDPQFHEAMFEQPTGEAEPGFIVHIMETGYTMHDRLLRPAKVGIAKAPPAPVSEVPQEHGEAPSEPDERSADETES